MTPPAMYIPAPGDQVYWIVTPHADPTPGTVIEAPVVQVVLDDETAPRFMLIEDVELRVTYDLRRSLFCRSCGEPLDEATTQTMDAVGGVRVACADTLADADELDPQGGES